MNPKLWDRLIPIFGTGDPQIPVVWRRPFGGDPEGTVSLTAFPHHLSSKMHVSFHRPFRVPMLVPCYPNRYMSLGFSEMVMHARGTEMASKPWCGLGFPLVGNGWRPLFPHFMLPRDALVRTIFLNQCRHPSATGVTPGVPERSTPRHPLYPRI